MAAPFVSKMPQGELGAALEAAMDKVPTAVLERISALEASLAFHRERRRLQNQRMIDLAAAQRVRKTKILRLESELAGLHYALVAIASIDIADIKTVVPTPIPMPAGDGEPEEQAERVEVWKEVGRKIADRYPETMAALARGTSEEPLDPLRFFPTLEERKEALRRAMEPWASPSTLPFTRERIAGDTGLGTALNTALSEGVAYGWLSQHGDSYRWIDREPLQQPAAAQQPTEEAPATPANPSAAASEVGAQPAFSTADPIPAPSAEPIETSRTVSPPSKPVEILYQAIVRHAGQPAKVIRERAGLPDNYNSLFGVLNRSHRVRRDTAGGWHPIAP